MIDKEFAFDHIRNVKILFHTVTFIDTMFTYRRASSPMEILSLVSTTKAIVERKDLCGVVFAMKLY